MALEIHTVELRAKDSISPTMEKIGQNAAKASKATEKAWADAGQASKRSAEEMRRSAAAIGAGLGTVVAGVSLAGRAFVAQEQQIRGLDRSYGEASRSMQEFSEEIQRTTTFSNDQARQSELTAATLVRNYGFTTQEIKKLLTISADLAAANGTTLTDATQRVAAAMRGEAESAEALGLTLNQAAIDREGLTLTMSNEEAAHFRLNALITQSAFAHGAAADAADTNAGKARQFLNLLQDQTQSFGGSLGPMGEYLSVLGDIALAAPLAGAAIGKISSALGVIGGGKAIGGIAALAAASYYAYSLNQSGSGAENATAGFLADAAGLFGLGGVQSQFQGIVDANTLTKLTTDAFYVSPGAATNEDPNDIAIMQLKNAGVLPWTFDGTIADAAAYISSQAGPVGLSSGQYIDRKIQASKSYTFDSVTGKYVYNDTYSQLDKDRRLLSLPSVGTDPRQGYGSMYAISQGATGRDPYNGRPIYNPFKQPHVTDPMGSDEYYAGPGPAYAKGGSGAVANSLSGAGNAPIVMSAANQQAANAANIQAQTDALVAQYPAWQNIITGINSANDATSAFTAAQASLGSEMDTYQGQAAEWNSELNAQTAAYDILQQRQADGIELTKEQTEFLNNYTHANEIGTAAVEDATIAAGMSAQSMLLNKEAADAQKSSTDDLTDTIRLLIMALDGVPEEVRTQVILDTDPALGALYNFLGLIPSSVTIPMYVSGTDIGNFLGGGYQHGGVIPGARHGRVVGNGYTLVGEDGPELLSGGRGAGGMVIPASATRAKMRNGGGGGDMHFNAPITVIANDPRTFANQMREYSVGGSRA